VGKCKWTTRGRSGEVKEDPEEIRGKAGASMVPDGKGGYHVKLPDKVDWLVAGHTVKSEDVPTPRYEVAEGWREALDRLDERIKEKYGPTKTFLSYELLWKFLSATEELFTVVPTRSERLGPLTKAGIKELLRGYYRTATENVLDEAAYIISKGKLLRVEMGTVTVQEFLE